MIGPAEAVRSRLLALPAVAGMVGGRIYVLIFPQSCPWPAIRVTQVSEIEDYHGRGSVGYRRARVQVDCAAVTYTEAAALLELVHGTYTAGVASGLTGFRGLVGGMPIAGVFAEGRRDLYDAEDLGVVRLSRDYAVEWRQG